MPSRFEPAPLWAERMVREVIEADHPSLSGVSLLVLFDTRKRMSKGALVAATIRKASDLMNAVADRESEFVMTLDAKLFNSEAITEADKKSIVYHELCHLMPDEGGYKLIGHDYTLFNGEVTRHGGMDAAARFQVNIGVALAGVHEELGGEA